MKNKKAFTLVELIVVIVILAILATIAFLSFSSQSASARDSTRLSDMSNIAKGLSVFNANAGNYPKPDNSITITASGVTIGYQGYAGASVLGIAKLSNGGKDPLDTSTYYTYNTNANQSKFQILGFLEDGSNSALSYVPHGIPAFAGMTEGGANADPSSYSGRYVITKGDQLGILLSSGSMVPVQASAATYGNSIELKSYTGGEFVGYISKNNIIKGVGTGLGGLAGFYTNASASSKYPNCDTQDIKLANGQVWAACNVGANIAWNNQVTITNCLLSDSDCDSDIRNTIGSYFQWGRNDDVTATSTSAILAIAGTSSNGVGNNNFILSGASLYDWIAIQNDNLWGGSGTSTTSGTFLSLGSPAAMQGPCAMGYHVPTTLEWGDTILAINPGVNPQNLSWQNDTSIVNILKLPLSGLRDGTSAVYRNQISNGCYWSSTPSGTQAYNMQFNVSQVSPAVNHFRTYGFPVRCIKD